jgi:hypothetical protein
MNKQEEEHMKLDSSTVKSILFYFMIAVVVTMCFYLIYHVRTESVKCMAEPWSYKLKTISTPDNRTIDCQCACSFLPGGKMLYVTQQGVSIEDDKINYLGDYKGCLSL